MRRARIQYPPSIRGGLLYPLLIPPPAFAVTPLASLVPSLSRPRRDRSPRFPHRRRPPANRGALPAISRELINEYRRPRLICQVRSGAR